MGLQKYRADTKGAAYDNGAVPHYTQWVGGPTLAKIENCPTPFGPRTVYVTGEADTWFSLPAACTFRGKTVRGWLGFEDNKPEFRASLWNHWFPFVAKEEST